jgi:hypothetical protein
MFFRRSELCCGGHFDPGRRTQPLARLAHPLACRFVSLLDRVRLMPLLDAR